MFMNVNERIRPLIVFVRLTKQKNLVNVHSSIK